MIGDDPDLLRPGSGAPCTPGGAARDSAGPARHAARADRCHHRSLSRRPSAAPGWPRPSARGPHPLHPGHPRGRLRGRLRRAVLRPASAPCATTCPTPTAWAARITTGLLEVMTGVRPAPQVLRWTSPEVYAVVARRSALVARRVAEGRSTPHRPRLGSPGAGLRAGRRRGRGRGRRERRAAGARRRRAAGRPGRQVEGQCPPGGRLARGWPPRRRPRPEHLRPRAVRAPARWRTLAPCAPRRARLLARASASPSEPELIHCLDAGRCRRPTPPVRSNGHGLPGSSNRRRRVRTVSSSGCECGVTEVVRCRRGSSTDGSGGRERSWSAAGAVFARTSTVAGGSLRPAARRRARVLRWPSRRSGHPVVDDPGPQHDVLHRAALRADGTQEPDREHHAERRPQHSGAAGPSRRPGRPPRAAP